MPRNKTTDATTTTTDDSLVAVEYHDGSTFTFDLHLVDRKVSFVEGKAQVDEETAQILRDGGHVA